MTNTHFLIARAGGGGSGGGGGGGGGHGGGGGSSAFSLVIYLIIFIVVTIAAAIRRRQVIKQDLKIKETLATLDPSWNPQALEQRVREVFLEFQRAWNAFDVEALKAILTEDERKRIVLELAVLQAEHRRNDMENVRISELRFYKINDAAGDDQDSFLVEISASAKDILFDTERNVTLYTDSAPFIEFWEFRKEGGVWKLSSIRQATENASLVEKDIAAFAKEHGFYFDPDFGWLMLPKKGAIFNQATFLNSDVNNHVIGWMRNTVVEFYTFIAKQNAPNYLIAQAILPKSYNNILVRRRKRFNFGPRGLRRIELESTDFNKRFCLWADPADNVASLELLTPNFMEWIYQLPFEINIEVVGKFLYFYTKDRSKAQYKDMLEILIYAFNEMKM